MGKRTTTPPAWLAGKLADAAAFNHLVDEVERCIDAGLLRPGTDAFLAAVGLWMSVHGLVSLMIAKPHFPWPPVEEVIDHVLDTHVLGLADRSH